LRKYAPAIGLILLTAVLLMLLAVLCDYFRVYIPGVAQLIPAERRPLPESVIYKPAASPIVKEEVIVIDKQPQPSPSGSPGSTASPTATVSPTATASP
jgi:hypothetical protein